MLHIITYMRNLKNKMNVTKKKEIHRYREQRNSYQSSYQCGEKGGGRTILFEVPFVRGCGEVLAGLVQKAGPKDRACRPGAG